MFGGNSWLKDARTSCPNSSKHQEKDLLETHTHSEGKITIPEGLVYVLCPQGFGDTLQSSFYHPTDNSQALTEQVCPDMSYAVIFRVLSTVWELPLPELRFVGMAHQKPVSADRQGAQTMPLLLLSADVLSVMSCSSALDSAFPLSLCSLIQAIKSNCVTRGQTQRSSKQGFVWLFYSPVP